MANKNKVFWPAWRYGPEGASGVFQSENDVPAGWVENPNDVVEPDAPKPEDGSDAWGGHTKKELQAALRKSGGEGARSNVCTQNVRESRRSRRYSGVRYA